MARIGLQFPFCFPLRETIFHFPISIFPIRTGKKKRGARLRRVGFPVYNLMKSFCTVVNVLPLLFVSPPFSFIDDTKVRHISTSAKNRNRNLLSSYQGGIGAENTHKLHIAPKMGFLAKKSPFEIGCSGGFVEKIAEEKNIFFLKFFEKKFSEAFFRTKTAGQRVWPAVIFVR